MEEQVLHFREAIVFLFAAGLIIPIAQRFRISPVLGFLLIGVLIGPHGIAQFASYYPPLAWISISDGEAVHALAELGVVLLLFVIGLELSMARLWAMRRLVFGLGGTQVAVSAVAIGLVAAAFGNSGAASIVLGSCLALSSTAIVMQLLTESRRLSSPTGHVSFSILLLQDLAVVPILFIVGIMGTRTEGSVLAAFSIAIVQAAVTIAAIMAAGRLVIRPLFHVVGATHSRELFMAAVLLVVIGTAMITAMAGLSMALGAFLAGLLLADTEYKHQVEVDIDPFKGLLLGLFFMSIGMGIDPAAVAAAPVLLLLSMVGLYVLKSAIIFVLARLFATPTPVAAETALLLGQGGEFAFVVIGIAVAGGVLPTDIAQFMLIVAGLSMLVTPLMVRLARTVALRLEAQQDAADAAGDEPPSIAEHVIIAGYGRVGQMIGSMIGAEGVPHVAVDADSGLVAKLRREGAGVYFGDASRPEMLHRLGIDKASAMVVTMDSAAAAERIVAAVRLEQPNLPILARARDTAHALRLVAAGATKVVPETVEASLQLSESVLVVGAGLPEEAARLTVETRRRQEADGLQPRG